VVDVALHIQNRHAAVSGDFVEVAVADAPVAVADGDAVKITSVNLADFLGGIAVRDLGCLALDEGAMSAELRHASFKRAARAGAAEEEQHCQNFIAQVGMGFAEGALALEVPSDVEDSFDFFLREIQIANQVTAM